MVRRYGRAWALAAAAVLFAAGCSAEGASQGSEPEAVALRVDTPVHEPVWSDEKHVLLALSEEDPRILKIEPPVLSGPRLSARTTLSEPFPGMGENLAASATGEAVVYLARPRLDRVAEVAVVDLRPTRMLPGGPAPSYVVRDAGSDVLLALSEDGSTVTGVDLQSQQGADVVTSRRVVTGPDGKLDGPDRGRLIEYYAIGPDRITHYKGGSWAVEKTGSVAIKAATSTGDKIKVSRLYAAEEGTDRLFAVDVARGGEGLEVVARSRLGAPVHHLGADDHRIYAATEQRLVVLETNSFEGYADKRFTVVDTIDFRDALPDGAVQKAPLSGLAVGAERVYLTLKGVPYVLSVAKPSL